MILLFELPEKFSVVSQRLEIDVLTNGQAKFVPDFELLVSQEIILILNTCMGWPRKGNHLWI